MPAPPDIPLRTLYHYTSRDGFKGILASKELWATEIRFLNDSTEFATAIDAVARELRARLDDLDSAEERERAEGIFRDLESLEEAEYFVTSLTEEHDDLNQWRAYGGAHTGFALGFNVEGLVGLASQHGFELDRCLYRPMEHTLLAATIVDAALAWPAEGDRMNRRRRREFRRTMSHLAPFLKNHHFRPENEWRLVSSPPFAFRATIRFRKRLSHRIPYLRFPLVAADGSSPLCSVTVGPSPDFDAAKQSASILLKRLGLGSTPIHASDVPLRTW